MIRHLFILIFLVHVSCGQSNSSKIVSTIVEADHGIEWLPDRADIQAGAIMVPENHDDPDGKKIQITYVIIKAKDTTSAEFPIIYFSGGPGGKQIDQIQDAIDFIMKLPIREKRDMILFDQRGIGYSSALPDMSFGSFDIMAKDAAEDEELELMTALILDYKKRCEDRNIGLEFYNTHQNARDVGMLFKHLGYDKYNLQGGSYGTRLGRVVQDFFPEYVNCSVLDSPAPISSDFLIDRLDSYSLALGRIFDYCENNSDCKGEYPDLKDEYFKAIATLTEAPLKVEMNDSVDVYINAQDGIYLLRRLLYQSNAREKAPELIRAYIEGGGEVINDVLQAEYQLTGGLNLSMLWSVEKYEAFNPKNTAKVIEEHYKNYPLLPAKLGFFDAFYQAGANWHNANLALEERVFETSDIPTLVLVNQFDPVTPPKNGHLFMEKLNNGQLLILDEGGHGGGNRACKQQVIIDFMNNPMDTLDTSCLNIYEG